MAMAEHLSPARHQARADLHRHFGASAADNITGYRSFEAGSFKFRRDEYFAHIQWPGGIHQMPIDVFLPR